MAEHTCTCVQREFLSLVRADDLLRFRAQQTQKAKLKSFRVFLRFVSKRDKQRRRKRHMKHVKGEEEA